MLSLWKCYGVVCAVQESMEGSFNSLDRKTPCWSRNLWFNKDSVTNWSDMSVWSELYECVKWTVWVCEVNCMCVCEVNSISVWSELYECVKWTIWVCEVNCMSVWSELYECVKWTVCNSWQLLCNCYTNILNVHF